MTGWLARRRRRRVRARPIPPAWLEILTRTAPFVGRLEPARRAKLLGDVAVLVAEKTFIGAGGQVIDDEVKVTIAAAAARLVLYLDVDRYDALTEIVVHPSAYQHPEGDAVILGEAHSWGVVVLAWDAVRAGLLDPRDGHDTAVHEFAHVLDRADGSFDGAPALRARGDYGPWAAVMQRHFERLRADDPEVARVLRDYGATNEAEFFAVATEAYFEKPAALERRAPALFAVLDRFYRG
ncbi:MAG: zinc-dependent peptidase [Kofleriaceae bacterium]